MRVYKALCVPPAEQYRLALAQPFVREHHRRMLRAHAGARDFTVSAKELALAAGYLTHATTNLHYGALGRAVADFLGIVTDSYSSGRLWTTAIAEGWSEPANGVWYWRLYPEVVAALDSTVGTRKRSNRRSGRSP